MHQSRRGLVAECETYRYVFIPLFQQLASLRPELMEPSCYSNPLANEQHCPILKAREEDIAIDHLIKIGLRDAKYNRKSNQIIYQLSQGNSYQQCGKHPLLDMEFDIWFRKQAIGLINEKMAKHQPGVYPHGTQIDMF